MKVAIIMGSNSDWPVLEAAEKTLKEFGVETEVVVASAHRTPDVVQNFAKGARDRGVEVIIAAAGAAAHLGGFIAAFTTVPVIGIPINATPLACMVEKLAEHRATMREEVRAKGEKLASMRGVPAQEFKDLHL